MAVLFDYVIHLYETKGSNMMTEEGPRRQRRKSEDQWATILNAAIAVISEMGYARAPLRLIAEKAGVATSQVNYYFGSKEELAVVVLRETWRKAMAEWERSLEAIPEPRSRLEFYINSLRKEIERNPPAVRVYMDFLTLGLFEGGSLQMEARTFQVSMVEFVRSLSGGLWNARDAQVAFAMLNGMTALAVQNLTPDEPAAEAWQTLEETLGTWLDQKQRRL